MAPKLATSMRAPVGEGDDQARPVHADIGDFGREIGDDVLAGNDVVRPRQLACGRLGEHQRLGASLRQLHDVGRRRGALAQRLVAWLDGSGRLSNAMLV